MTKLNVHDLINLKGYGKAEIELKKAGLWDEEAGKEYKPYIVKMEVAVIEEDEYICKVKARSEDEAENLAIKEANADCDVHEINKITEVTEP